MSTITLIDAPGGNEPEEDVAFAGATEIAARMGVTFTAAQTAQAEMLLTLAAEQILEAVQQTQAWASALDAVPSALRTTSIEMVARVMQNPAGVRSQSKTIGKVSTQQSFADVSAMLDLTDREQLRCVRAVHGATTASAHAASVIDDVAYNIGFTGAAIVEAPGS